MPEVAGSEHMTSVFIIAEAGVNHNGDLGTAHKLVEAAAKAGADAVKFQSFSADKIVVSGAPKAAYQIARTGGGESQFEMLQKLQLSEADHVSLANYARNCGIEFMSSPFDEGSADFLVKDIGVRRLKIPSGEITNAPLLLHMARLGRPVTLSTGASTLEEVGDALGVVAFGLLNSAGAPDLSRLSTYREAGQSQLKDTVTLLHCTTEYPAPVEDSNLQAISTLGSAFGLPVGLSDHSAGIALPIAAIGLGATVIEKHFTLDKAQEGPDHAASLEPDSFESMVSGIREACRALGDGVKHPAPSEMSNRTIVRRSLVALRDIAKGDVFSEDNLGSRRPAGGLSPFHYWNLIGQTADRSYKPGDRVANG